MPECAEAREERSEGGGEGGQRRRRRRRPADFVATSQATKSHGDHAVHQPVRDADTSPRIVLSWTNPMGDGRDELRRQIRAAAAVQLVGISGAGVHLPYGTSLQPADLHNHHHHVKVLAILLSMYKFGHILKDMLLCMREK